MDAIHLSHATTADGRHMQFFYNPENNLLVVDVVERGRNTLGRELVRMRIPPAYTPAERRSLNRQFREQAMREATAELA